MLITIAFGLGSNITVLEFIRGITVRNSPVPPNSSVISLLGVDPYRGTGPVSYEDYLLLKSHLDEFEWLGAARISQCVIKVADHTMVVPVADVTPSLMHVFNLSLDGGAVISRRLRQTEFGGKADISGEQIRIGDVNARVVGVAPDTLDGLYSDRPIDLWRALGEESLQGRDREARNLWVLAGLRRGFSANRIENAVRTGSIGSGEIKILPYTGMTPKMQEDLWRFGTLLRMAAGLVFFITCVNVASFVLGRATSRSRANAIRVALGVSRGRLVQAIVSDSVVIALAGGALSVQLAAWTSKVIPALLFEQDASFLVLVPDIFSMVAASAVGVGIIIACGLAPLLEIRLDRPAAVLGREGAGPSKRSRGVRAILVIAQMACCCLLVICTGLLYGNFRAAERTGVSRTLGQPVLATVHAHPDVSVDLEYFREVEQKARSLGGVSSIAWAARLPGSPPALRSFRIDPPGLPRREIRMDVAGFTSESVSQFSWPPKAGRSFGVRDQGCRTAMVNEEAAEVLFGDDTPGRSIQAAAGGTPVEIIGVLANPKRSDASRHDRPTIYYDGTNQAGKPSGRIAAVAFSAPPAARLDRAELNTNVVSQSYFAAMGLPPVTGGIFSEISNARGCRVAVINQEAADLYFGKGAVGAAIIDDLGERTQILGVVHSAQLGTFERQVEPTVYFPMFQDCLPTMTLIVGTRTADSPMLSMVQQTLESVSGGGAPLTVKTLDAYLSQTALAPLHIATALVGACTTTALFLGILGLYGILNDLARTRRQDLATRIALGARRRDVVRQILEEGGRLAAIGALGGMLGSLLVSQLLTRITGSIGAPKWWVWVAGPAVLAGVVTVAAVLPARRALLLDPLRVLRAN
ncbi:MAG TPA: ABC transporter permease [Bryobacteraceae bacterium]|nr:ABC transporter permease [Bryobacteraceae bacterium]